MEHTEKKHGYLNLHNLKEGNCSRESLWKLCPIPCNWVPACIDIWWRTPHKPLCAEHSSGECSKFRFCVAAQLPFSAVKISNMPTFRLPLLLGALDGTLWFFRTRKREATRFTLTFQCHCFYRSSAWSPVYCIHHYSLRAFLLREEQKNE